MVNGYSEVHSTRRRVPGGTAAGSSLGDKLRKSLKNVFIRRDSDGPRIAITSDRDLSLAKSRSLAYLHWGTLALFLVSYIGIPFAWGMPVTIFIIAPLTAGGFYTSWKRIGVRRTKKEVRLLTALTATLVVIALFVDVGYFDSFSILGADLVAAVCAGFSFSLKRAREYFYIIAASAAILVVGLLSRESQSIIPVLLWLCVLIPVVQQGRREHHRRSLRGSDYSLEEQGEKAPFLTGLMLPALILMLVSSLLYLVMPKPLREPPDVFRKLSTPQGAASPTDLREELPEPLNEGRSGVGEGLDSGGAGDSGQGGSAEGGGAQDGQDSGVTPVNVLLFEVACDALYPLRLKAFERLEGGVWKSSTQGSLYRSDYPRIEVSQIQEQLDGVDMYGFVETDFVFYMYTPGEREMPGGMNPITLYLEKEHGPPYSLFIDADDNLFSGKGMESGYTYGMTAMLPLYPSPEDGAIPPEISDRYAGEYEGVDGLGDIVRDATVGEVTQAGKVEALLAFIDDNFTYDPSVTLQPGVASLDGYINGDRRGDMELAVTALTLFCRELGIPARPVLGFIPRIFNEETGRFEVYSNDIYYWVEVYFSNCGWLSCFPTPRIEEGTQGDEVRDVSRQGFNFSGVGGTGAQADGRGGGSREGGGREGGGLESGESPERIGTGREQINEAMEELDSGRQSRGGPMSQDAPNTVSRDYGSVMLQTLLVLIGLFVLFIAGRLIWSWWRKRRRRGREAKDEIARSASLARDRERFIYLTYRKMCEELAEVGLSRLESETPDEFLARVKFTYPAATQYATPISVALEDSLYGMHPIDEESLRGLDTCLQYLRRLCLSIKSSSGEAWR